jgi:hypothetical protein
MVQFLYYKFEVGGVDITSYVLENTQIIINRNAVNGNTANIYVSDTVDSVLTLTEGQVVNISRGTVTSTDSYKFKGHVKKISSRENIYLLECKDVMNQLKYNLFTKSYDINIDDEAGEVSAIFKDIVEQGGFSASVVDSGTATTDLTIEKFISRKQSRFNRMSILAQILNWFFYYDYDNDWIRFEPKGYVEFATTLTVGGNVYNIPKWTTDIENMRNKLTVEGAYELDTREETETGDDSTTEFSFTYPPETTDLTVDGVLQKRGIPNSSDPYDYVVDSELKTYTFKTAPTSGQDIVMKYTTRIPAPVTGSSTESIATYGLTQEDTYKFDDIVSVQDAETRLDQLLELLKDGIITTDLITDVYNINVGNAVNVVDPNRPSKSDQYIVQKVTINYPSNFDTISIGTIVFNVQDLFMTIQERLKALENPDTGLIEILRHILSLNHDVIFEKRYTKLQKREITGDSLIWGHPTLGIWGTNKWSSGLTEPLVTTKLNQGNNIYKEYFYDDDFEGTGTATWNTSTKALEFTSGQTHITSVLSLGTTYTYATLTLGSLTGTVTCEISADGGDNWQTLTRGTRTSLTNSDETGVYLRFTESGNTTATITNTYKTSNRYDLSGIKLILEE